MADEQNLTDRLTEELDRTRARLTQLETLEAHRRQMDGELREREARYHQIFDRLRQATLLIDPSTGTVVDANLSASGFYGHAREQLVGMNLASLSALTQEQLFQELLTVIAEQRHYFTFLQRSANGDVRDVEAFYSTVDAHGKRLLCTVIIDVTERNRTRERSVHCHRSGLVCPWYWDIDTGHLRLDPVARELFRYREEPGVEKQEWLALFHRDDQDRLMAFLSEASQNEQRSKAIELRVVRGDGAEGWVLCRGTLLRDGQGLSRLVAGVFIDVTDVRKAAETKSKMLTLPETTHELSPVPYILIGHDGKILSANGAATTYLATPRESLIGATLTSLIRNEDLPVLRSQVSEAVTRRLAGAVFDIQFVRKGEPTWTRCSIESVVQDSEAQPAVLLRCEDIHERMAIGEDLQRNDSLLAAIVETVTLLQKPSIDRDALPQALALLARGAGVDAIEVFENCGAPDSNDTFMGKRHEWLGEGLERPPQLPPLEHLSYRSLPSTWYATLLSGKAVLVSTCELPAIVRAQLDPLGLHSVVLVPLFEGDAFTGVLWLESRAGLRRWSDRELSLLSVIAQCIGGTSAYHRQINELLKSEARYRNIVQSMQDVVFQMDATGLWTFLSSAWQEATGFAVSDSIGTFFLNYVHPDDRQHTADEFQALIEGRHEQSRHEARFVTKAGGSCWIEVYARLQKDDQGRIAGISGTLWNIARRKAAEEALLESERKYRTLFEESRDAIFISTPEGRFIDINPAGIELFGFTTKEEVLNLDLARDLYVNPEDRKTLKAKLEEEGYIKDYEVTLKHTDGDHLTVLITASVIYGEVGSNTVYRGIIRDVTQQKKLERQLLHSQKMEAIGQLAGGVAHDFNNILTGIMGYGEILKNKADKNSPLIPYIEQIIASSERGANLTQSLIAFSRTQEISPEPLDLDVIIKRMESLLSRVIGEDIELRTSLTDRNLIVMADSGRIEQLLIHLATNAQDWMPNGGVLTIATELTELDREFKRTHGFGEPGTYAHITVTDTGMGMDEETRKRIFEPFFTTKEVGKGSGLGLSIVYGIVKQHNGYIDVMSEVGRGTTFSIHLPVIRSKEQLVKSLGLTMPKGGKETILLTEDDEVVRELIRNILEGFGYQVIVATDGAEAVIKFLEQKELIKLLITDVVMPKKTGKEVFEEIKAIQPSIKVIFISGYDDDVIGKKGIFSKEVNFLAKPFSTKELLNKVRQVLDE